MMLSDYYHDAIDTIFAHLHFLPARYRSMIELRCGFGDSFRYSLFDSAQILSLTPRQAMMIEKAAKVRLLDSIAETKPLRPVWNAVAGLLN